MLEEVKLVKIRAEKVGLPAQYHDRYVRGWLRQENNKDGYTPLDMRVSGLGSNADIIANTDPIPEQYKPTVTDNLSRMYSLPPEKITYWL